MKRKARILVIASSAALLVCAAILSALWLGRETTLDVQVCDSVSGRWVYDLAMRIQGREMYGYYQSDAGLMICRFHHLSPGRAVLEVAAPSYEGVQVPVILRKGAKNRIEKPIALVGTGIPDLTHIYVFETVGPADIAAQLRPTNSKGTAILNHPCMDLWIGCRAYIQMKNGLPVQRTEETGSTRGEEIFRGKIDWAWDPAPETQFRYTARIPRSAIAAPPGSYLAIDYLIVEPNPQEIGRAELDDLMGGIFALRDTAEMTAALDREKGKLSYFLDTSWNLKGGQE
ncbi:MAG: hypothetical protein ABSF77_00270 [Spirochaetia bacterium]|jgi:hypothetical protein